MFAMGVEVLVILRETVHLQPPIITRTSMNTRIIRKLKMFPANRTPRKTTYNR
jgi:hypothetical protein